MINWFDMPAEGLSNGGLFEVKELEVTENGTYETKGEMYNKVTVNVEGGGGSSDFSTAVLTMTNTTENPVIFEVPCYRDGAEVLLTRAVIFGALGGEPATETINVVCKSNGATLSIASEGVTATTSGDIQFIQGQNLYIITGDCIITIS